MFKEKVLSASIFCLSISIIISAIIVANAIKRNGDYVNSGLSSVSGSLTHVSSSLYNMNNNNVVTGRSTFDLAAASAYLGISELRLLELVDAEDSRLPYIKIGYDYVFGRDALEKWMETARVEIK